MQIYVIKKAIVHTPITFYLQTYLMFKFKFKIGLVEIVQPNVTVFSSGCISHSVRVKLDRVDGAEMALNPAEFLFENHVEKAGVELANSGRCRGHVHGLLTSTEDDL